MSSPTLTKKQSHDVNLLRDELQVALLAAEDIRALRAKVSVLVVRVREEKEKRLLVEENQGSIEKKLTMITDHMEKLMNHLRIESKQKQKIIDSRRTTRRELIEMRGICERQQKIIASKNRYIHEITEGSKLLEDQLRLMDDKYMDMRKKLDYAREAHKNDVGKAEKKMMELRRKFSALTGSNKTLDSMPMPRGGSGTVGGPNTMESQRGVSWAAFPNSPDGSAVMNNKYGVATPQQQGRAHSAPMKRPGTTKSSKGLLAPEPPPTWEKVSAKIEKKKRAMGGQWDVEKAYEVLEEAQVANGTKPKPKPKPKEKEKEVDNMNVYYNMTSGNNSAETLPQATSPSHSITGTAPANESLPAPMARQSSSTGTSFSILGKKNKYARDEDDF